MQTTTPKMLCPEKDGIWTIESYAIYNTALRVADKELYAEKVLHLAEVVELNDRRYGEVGIEKEKALKIKEIADLSALELARESQVYKDERNDTMREQNLKDNGIYATRDDLADVVKGMEKALKPLVDFVSSQQGAASGRSKLSGAFNSNIALICTIIGAVIAVIYFVTNK